MKVGVIDVDGHNYPNLPLMKLSAWHKAQGDNVEWYDQMTSGHFDIVIRILWFMTRRIPQDGIISDGFNAG